MTDFFDGRTLGCEARLDGRNPWFWRGPGYDEGWAEVTDDELRDLQRLLDAYFGVERHDALVKAVDTVMTLQIELAELKTAIKVWFGHIDNSDVMRAMTAAEALQILARAEPTDG